MPAVKRSVQEPNGQRRRSGRLSSTPKKSSYFEGPDSESDDDDDDDLPPKKRRRSSAVKKQPAAVKHESEDQYEDEEDEPEEDEGDDEEDEEDAPPKVTIIPLEKMRDTGGVEYENQKIHKNTLLFLKDLKANNRRPWLKSHDGEYRRAVQDWNTFVEATTQSIISVDETIPELPVKDVIFRIHRDIRFSKDPTPYKPHFSAAWSRTGRKGPYACYYVHAEPGASFIGGGLWCPDASHIAKLRHSIDRHPARWRRALGDLSFRRTFFPEYKSSTSVEKVVEAFIAKNQHNALKKRPMGYEVTHRDIGLLRLRNFTVGAKIEADMLCRDDAQEKMQELFRGLFVFVTFLNSIVMPDPDMEEEDSDDSENYDDE